MVSPFESTIVQEWKPLLLDDFDRHFAPSRGVDRQAITPDEWIGTAKYLRWLAPSVRVDGYLIGGLISEVLGWNQDHDSSPRRDSGPAETDRQRRVVARVVICAMLGLPLSSKQMTRPKRREDIEALKAIAGNPEARSLDLGLKVVQQAWGRTLGKRREQSLRGEPETYRVLKTVRVWDRVELHDQYDRDLEVFLPDSRAVGRFRDRYIKLSSATRRGDSSAGGDRAQAPLDLHR